ncbi:hypothetical protein [Streptomyces sp. NPDC017673]|uniref:hypothetical protein n=1 Tax=unclassified Streptomyces TaxID=2593676 RepID=UPI0037A9579F
MGDGGAGGVRWNKDTQSWEPAGAGGHPAPPPPPGRPFWPPTTGGPADSGGGAPGERPATEPAGGAAQPDLPWPSSVPPQAPRGRQSRIVAAAVVAAVAVTALAGWLAVDMVGDDDHDKAGRTPSSTAGVSQDGQASSSGTSPSDDTYTTASESPKVPAGYRPVEDPSGFSTVVPEDWTRSEQNGGAVVFYTSPDKRGLLQIFEVVEEGYTPDDALDAAVDGLSKQPGFAQISRGPVSGETQASELVYEYNNKDLGERVKAVDRVFQADDGRLYAMVVRGAADDWTETQETLEDARSAFTPS